MARILITSGPTRQYIDPVRYLTNASSGRMGSALATAAIARGHEVIIVSGPVQVSYPTAARLVRVVSTREMLEACCQEFPQCDGLIGAAAPCDYQPEQVATRKISKTTEPLRLQLIETPDVIATLGTSKRADQWLVGFALETHDRHLRALAKLKRKRCDLMILNGPQAIDADSSYVEMIDERGDIVAHAEGTKQSVANLILQVIQTQLIDPPRPQQRKS